MAICFFIIQAHLKMCKKKQAQVATQQKMQENLKSFLTSRSSTTVVDCSDVIDDSCGLDVEESL